MISQNLIFIIAAVAIFSIVPFMIKKFKPENKVDLLRPRDRRGKSLTIARETDLGIECKKTANYIYRFIKAGPAWVFSQGGKMVTKFFAIEGTAYTATVKGDTMVETPVSDYLKFLWGEQFYDSIPAPQKRAVETDVMGITVEIEPIDPEEYGLKTLTAADLDDEGDSIVLNKISRVQKPSTKRDLYQFAVGAAMSAAIILFLMVKGWF